MIPKHSINAGYKFSTPTDADEAFAKVTLEDNVDSNDASDNLALKTLLSTFYIVLVCPYIPS